jgi:hypothetical protein
MSEDNHRRHPRIETQQSVWVEGQDLRVPAQAKNMSRGGMFVVSESAPPEVGSTLQIRFDDPHEGKIEVTMQVVWRDESTVSSKLGLKALDSRGLNAFERVVKRHEKLATPSGEQPTLPPAKPSTPDAL